jgi:hypothetical protein
MNADTPLVDDSCILLKVCVVYCLHSHQNKRSYNMLYYYILVKIKEIDGKVISSPIYITYTNITHATLYPRVYVLKTIYVTNRPELGTQFLQHQRNKYEYLVIPLVVIQQGIRTCDYCSATYCFKVLLLSI